MARFLSKTLCLLVFVGLSACTPPWLNNGEETQPATAPNNSQLAPVSSCRVPEPELFNAARAVIGDVVVTRPGIEGDVDKVDVNICKVTDSRATATVTVLGMHDDSVKDTRHELVLDKLVARGWVVTSDTTTQRCQLNRGHQDFSPDPCV